MPYKISIEKTSKEPQLCGKDWKIIGDHEDGTKKFGYTPEITKNVEVIQVIYTQVVDDLDLVLVINAVNRGTSDRAE